MTNYKQLSVQDRIHELTGGSTTFIEEALSQWEYEREINAGLQDENQALTIQARHMILALDIMEKNVHIIEKECAMFMSPKSRALLEKFKELYEQVQAARNHSKEMIQKPETENPNVD